MLPSRLGKISPTFSNTTPSELCQRVLTSHHDGFIVKAQPLSCDKCGKIAREQQTNCSECARLLSSSTNSFTVKLADTGVKAHGVISAVLSVWNPTRLTCRVWPSGKDGSQLELRMSGTLTLVEMVFVSIVCAALSWLNINVFTTHEVFHLIVALLIFPLGPVIYYYHRRKHYQDLLSFITERIPKLLSDGTAEKSD
jgi:hypothetical protein